MRSEGRRRAAGLIAATAILALGLSGCGDDKGATTAPDLRGVDVTVGWVGGEDGSDALVGELYAQALEAGGATVERRPGLSHRQEGIEQLQAGALTVMPEHSHALVDELMSPAGPEATTIAEQLDALEGALPAGLTVLTPSSANANDVVACRQAVIDEHELRTRTDLEQFIADRPGEIDDDDCRTLAATDAEIAHDDLVALVDDQLETPIDAFIPLVRTSAATPQLQATLDAVSSTLEPATLPALLASVRFDGDHVKDVVRDWLKAVDIT